MWASQGLYKFKIDRFYYPPRKKLGMTQQSESQDVPLANIERIGDINLKDYNMLFAIAQEPLYGTKIKERLDPIYTEHLNHGNLYPRLDYLDEIDLVDKGKINGRKNRYAITDRGCMLLVELLEWQISSLLPRESATDIVRQIEEEVKARLIDE